MPSGLVVNSGLKIWLAVPAFKPAPASATATSSFPVSMRWPKILSQAPRSTAGRSDQNVSNPSSAKCVRNCMTSEPRQLGAAACADALIGRLVSVGGDDDHVLFGSTPPARKAGIWKSAV